jgi:hypothetical protein
MASNFADFFAANMGGITLRIYQTIRHKLVFLPICIKTFYRVIRRITTHPTKKTAMQPKILTTSHRPSNMEGRLDKEEQAYSSAPDTLKTPRNGGVRLQPRGRDRLSAIGTIAVFTRVQPTQSGRDFGPLRLPAPSGRLRHRLILQRVHARQPTNGLLVQFHSPLPRLSGSVLYVEGCEAGLEGS